MTNIDEIKSTIVKSLETASNYDFAVVYANIISCGDCPYWHDCRNEYDCAEYILNKLRANDEAEKAGEDL